MVWRVLGNVCIPDDAELSDFLSMDFGRFKSGVKEVFVERVLSEDSHLQNSAGAAVKCEVGKSLVMSFDGSIVQEILAGDLLDGVLREVGVMLLRFTCAIGNGENNDPAGLQ